ncbi:hypothetical protein GGP63_002710 [Salinibacter ruber]|nr:hypothetical protein [Salinibacter ruber]MCS3648109.1 hypothetical protein [Salinibacter ruber]
MIPNAQANEGAFAGNFGALSSLDCNNRYSCVIGLHNLDPTSTLKSAPLAD